MANWLLIALLLRISDAAGAGPGVHQCARRAGPAAAAPPAQLHGAPTEVIRP